MHYNNVTRMWQRHGWISLCLRWQDAADLNIPKIKEERLNQFCNMQIAICKQESNFYIFRLRHYSKYSKSAEIIELLVKGGSDQWLKCMFQLKIWAIHPLMSGRQLYEMNGWLNSFLAWNIINHISHIEVFTTTLSFLFIEIYSCFRNCLDQSWY